MSISVDRIDDPLDEGCSRGGRDLLWIDHINIKIENAGGNADLRKSIVPIKSELELVRLVLNAAKAGKPYSALRPRTIDPWLITEEKNRLIKLQ